MKTTRQVTLDYDPQTFTAPGLVILEARKLDADGELWLLNGVIDVVFFISGLRVSRLEVVNYY